MQRWRVFQVVSQEKAGCLNRGFQIHTAAAAQRGPGGIGQGAGKPRQGNLVGLRAAPISQHVAYDIEGVVVRSIYVPLRLQDLAF